MFNYLLTIGDRSGDGHSFCRDFILTTNKSRQELIDAYLNSREKTRISFTGCRHKSIASDPKDADIYEFLTEGRFDDHIPEEDVLLFASKGLDLEKYLIKTTYGTTIFDDIEDFACLLMDFVHLSSPDMTYSLTEVDRDSYNTTHLEDFDIDREFFGYGLYTGSNYEQDYHGDKDDEDYDEDD